MVYSSSDTSFSIRAMMTRRPNLTRSKLGSIAAFLCACIAMMGCGNGRSHNDDKISVDPSIYKNGRVVNPEKVPDRLRRTGLRVVFRSAQKPADFDSAIYGTASNSRGIHVNFGFFFIPGDKAGEHFRPGLMRLVPGATDEGSTSGESYIAITSAGRNRKRGSREASEELELAGDLHWAVAGLARKALEEEGP